MRLSTGGAQKAKSIIGSLPGSTGSLLQGQTAIADTRLEIGYGFLPMSQLKRRDSQKLRNFGGQCVGRCWCQQFRDLSRVMLRQGNSGFNLGKVNLVHQSVLSIGSG